MAGGIETPPLFAFLSNTDGTGRARAFLRPCAPSPDDFTAGPGELDKFVEQTKEWLFRISLGAGPDVLIGEQVRLTGWIGTPAEGDPAHEVLWIEKCREKYRDAFGKWRNHAGPQLQQSISRLLSWEAGYNG